MSLIRKLLYSHWFVGIFMLVVLLGFYTSASPLLERLQLATFDIYQQILPRKPVAGDAPVKVVIVDIDEKSLRDIGQWPWPRTVLANLVDKLTEYGVAVVGFDMVFAEEDRTSPDLIAKERDDIPRDLADKLAQLPSNERIFAAAIARGRVVLGQVGVYEQTPDEKITRKVGYGFLSPDPQKLIHPYLNQYDGVVNNRPELEKAAQGLGLFSTTADSDGTFRRVALVERIGDKIYPSLSLEMLRVALGGGDDYLIKGFKDGSGGTRSVIVKSPHPGMPHFEIPTDRNGRVWVHFARYPTGSPPLYISARDILLEDDPEKMQQLKAALQNNLTIVGTSAAGLKDIRKTPINGIMPGVEIHAQLLETILANAHLTRTDEARMIELVLIVVGGLLMILLVPYLNSVYTFLLSATLMSGLISVAWYYYENRLELVDASYPSVAIFVMFLTLSYLNYMREEKERREVKNAFSHYVSPALLEQLADHPEQLALGGETRNITVMFSDIRGFTTISEQFDAHGLTQFINKFLTPMTNVIMEHRGTIDKYMGDAIMAFWNAPLSVPDHPAQACYAGLEMQTAVRELNLTMEQEAKQRGRKHIPIRIGIGINTGDCCVGNMGSEQRFDYSALGDDVNLASRLEGQSKTYGVDIVIGENTQRQVMDEFAIVELDLIQVKGKTEPVFIHALLGDEKFRNSQEFIEISEINKDLLAAYRSQKWDDAEKYAKQLARLSDGLRGLADLYLSRVRQYRASPPPPHWDGVYVATTK